MVRLSRAFPFRSFLMLLAAIGVLFAPVAEALECSAEDVPTVVEMMASHSNGDGETDKQPAEKSATCAHGHCHHTSTALERGQAFDAQRFMASTRLPLRVARLASVERDLPKRPPRA
ncbi:hypothetical protein FHS61_003103 [Altererythrobacter atlanticus]|uniref:Uncharacterized protein n=1 Tax=Croceibacterium atlanticum TaxID=1267766 RepID=A0A0F7KTT6_9SPHN|nr:hypothetical protein WYH_01954 [Croceibacterium atlanticum]MBB5734054.1 hypothetical protein [Croceibacterium atlanticum]